MMARRKASCVNSPLRERRPGSANLSPMQQLAFDRRHPIAQEIAAYRKRSADRVAMN